MNFFPQALIPASKERHLLKQLFSELQGSRGARFQAHSRSPTVGRRCPPIAPDRPPWPDERQVNAEYERFALSRSLSRALVGAALPATPGLGLN